MCSRVWGFVGALARDKRLWSGLASVGGVEAEGMAYGAKGIRRWVGELSGGDHN